MEIDIVPYRKEFLEGFVYDGVEKEISGEQILPVVDFYARLGACYIGKVDGRVLGVGGIYPLWEKTGGCFLFLNKEAQNHKRGVFEALLIYMSELIKKYEIKTLIVECIDDSMQAKNLITHLGFKKAKEVKMATYIRG